MLAAEPWAHVQYCSLSGYHNSPSFHLHLPGDDKITQKMKVVKRLINFHFDFFANVCRNAILELFKGVPQQWSYTWDKPDFDSIMGQAPKNTESYVSRIARRFSFVSICSLYRSHRRHFIAVFTSWVGPNATVKTVTNAAFEIFTTTIRIYLGFNFTKQRK